MQFASCLFNWKFNYSPWYKLNNFCPMLLDLKVMITLGRRSFTSTWFSVILFLMMSSIQYIVSYLLVFALSLKPPPPAPFQYLHLFNFNKLKIRDQLSWSPTMNWQLEIPKDPSNKIYKSSNWSLTSDYINCTIKQTIVIDSECMEIRLLSEKSIQIFMKM